MACVSPKASYSGSRSTDHKFQILDYGPWQQSKQKIKPFTLLPVLQTSNDKKSKMKTWISIQPTLGYAKPAMLMTGQLKNPREPREPRKGKLDSGKAKFRLLKMMLRNRQTALQELRDHEDFIIKLNRELVKTIQDMEDSSALKMRRMLQQQNVFRTIAHVLESSGKKQLQRMKCELQEWKEKEESKMNCLKQQMEQLNAKVTKMQEEVNFLSTYMDHEYPVKSVRIDNLVRQLQQVKDNEQDELDGLNEMGKKVLESLSNEIQMKKKKLLSSLVVKTQQPHQEVLLQKTWENHNMVKYTDKYREFASRFDQEIPKLRAKVEQLRVQSQEPREIVFADVLLRRPKCTPDMDVTLSIPVEEVLPF